MSDTSFDIVIQSQDEAWKHSYMFTLWPRQWGTYSKCHKWQSVRLDGSEGGNIPDSPGIYTLVAVPHIANHPFCSYLMYVGQSKSLRRRFREYLSQERKETGRPKIFRFLHLYQDHVWFCYTLVQSTSLDSVESGLRDAYIPPLNNQFSGELSKVVGAF